MNQATSKPHDHPHEPVLHNEIRYLWCTVLGYEGPVTQSPAQVKAVEKQPIARHHSYPDLNRMPLVCISPTILNART